MAVFGGSLDDEPLVVDLLRVVLPILEDDVESLAVAATHDEPAPVIEYMTPAVNEYVALAPALTYIAPSPVMEYVASTLALVDELAPFEREQQQTVEVPMPQSLKETVEVDEMAPCERVQQQTVEVPLPQILEETVEEVRLSSHE